MTEDEKNLDLLSLFHYILGGVTALFACLPLIHVFLGLLMVSEAMPGDEIPAFFGWLFVGMGALFVTLGWALAMAMLVAGSKLKRRTSRTYCLVIAALECMLMPLGTILGVFTLIHLNKDSVKDLFAASTIPAA